MENGIITSNKEKVKVKKPKHYKVVMHNDDFTTMEFVVDVLMTVFNKDLNKSDEIMLVLFDKIKYSLALIITC